MRSAPTQKADKGTAGPLKGKRPVANVPGGADQKGKTDQAGTLFTKTSRSGKQGDAPYSANPEVTEPPGELMYRYCGLAARCGAI